MQRICLDTETGLIRPGMQCPELVCVTWASGGQSGLLAWHESLRYLRGWLSDPNTLLYGHNFAFDMAVVCQQFPELFPLVFKAYEENRITCTMLRAMLQDCASGTLREGRKGKGGYSLEALVFKLLDKDISADKGADSWRTRYAELRNIAPEFWPKAARDYAVNDAILTEEVFLLQESRANPADVFGCEFIEARAHFGLKLIEAYGMTTDKPTVDTFKAECELHAYALNEKLRAAGIQREDGTEDAEALRARVAEAFAKMGKKPPLTAGGKTGTNKKIKTDGDTLLECTDVDPLLKTLADESVWVDNLSRYIPILERGCGGLPYHYRYNSILVTGRTSSTPPQNPPRKGLFRECHKPRPGFVYSFVDFSQLELCTLSQVNLWLNKRSAMADAINAGKDLHSILAAQTIGMGYEAFKARVDAEDSTADEQRFHAKAGNFGFPGGMGPEGFVAYAKGYGIAMSVGKARMLRNAWLASFPEMHDYFSRIKAHFKGRETATIRQYVTGRYRGDCFYTAACNTLFQGLAADGAKAAGFRLVKEAFAVPSSPFYGSRPVIFLHDEYGAEVPEEAAHDSAMRQKEIMVEAMQEHCPNVTIKASAPALMRRWYKKGKAVFDSAGRLTVWEPPAKQPEAQGVAQ